MVLRALLLFSLTLAAYSFVLGAPFRNMDDQVSIVANPLIKDITQVPRLFQQGYFGDHSYYRPLTNVSFFLEYQLFGLTPMYYYLDNILLHVVNALLVWAVAACLVEARVAFWAGLLFAIHPIQWEAVSNISGRAILLSTGFSLAAMWAFLRGRNCLAWLLFVPALLSKEGAMMVPFTLAVYCALNRRSCRSLWPWAVIGAGYVGLRHLLGITEIFGYGRWQDCVLAFLTFLKSLIIDVRLLIFPANLYFDRSLPVFSGFGESEAIMTMGVYVLFGVLLAVWRRRITPVQWLCLAWFGLCMLPVSQLVTSIGVQQGVISTADHFLYLACVPVFIVLMQGVTAIKSPVVAWARAGMAAFFFLLTIAQNVYASNEVVMLQRALKMQPHNARLHSSLGLLFAKAGNLKMAESEFAIAAVEDPGKARYKISLAKSVCDQGRFRDCLAIYDQIKDPQGFADLLADNRRAAVAAMGRLQHAEVPQK